MHHFRQPAWEADAKAIFSHPLAILPGGQELACAGPLLQTYLVHVVWWEHKVPPFGRPAARLQCDGAPALGIVDQDLSVGVSLNSKKR